jgi:4-diphosphocytidyl-2-C-methyl-D-erythritol kinase
MIFFPNAKINLGLDIIEKRPDGFHNIETLFVPCPEYCDILEVLYAEKFSMHLYGPALDGDPMDNLCAKAYHLMAKIYDLPPVAIHLYKKIPVGAGLGGGSSDAAATLILLNRMFSLDLNDDVLAGHAASLGSDCPFFIYNLPMYATGRGEVLSPVDISLDDYRIELVTPDIFISTKEAYAGVTPRKPVVSILDIIKRPVEEWRGLLKNDFEESLFLKYPGLAAEKEALYARGAVYASMSGSGSALYGLFKK